MVNLVLLLAVNMPIAHGNMANNNMISNDERFAVDQRGKFVVYKTEPIADGVSFSDINQQLTNYLTQKGNHTTTSGGNRLESWGSVTMKKHAGIGNYVGGTINYTLVVENDEGELNYWFTDLTYQPYRNDRYGKRVKASVSPIPLEKKMSKVNDKVWNKQRGYAYETIDQLADEVSSQLKAVGKSKIVTTSMGE
ncbi:hypothetical protein [Parapedobacter tibetensis]|uniref:hypothetical protein n=1 Tax=Parapedobacter tibetensis TaxID=2972951 RepID=UPI00214D3ED8|nr:hypothetical protein [Parapedobacter tibetensis]